MIDLLLHIVGTVVFTVLFLAIPYQAVRKQNSINLYSPKLILYFCTEISFAPNQWEYFKDRLKNNETENINVPLQATIKGIFAYPISRALIFITLAIFIFGVTIQLCTTFQLIQLKDLQSEFPLTIILPICCGPFFLYYVTSFSSDSYTMMKNETKVTEYLIELNWDSFSKSQLQRISKELDIDFLLFKNPSDLGTIIIMLGTGLILIYYRIAKYLTPNQILIVFSLFIVIVVSKNYYEGFRTRVIYVAMNALQDLIDIVEKNESTLSAPDNVILEKNESISVN